MQTETNTTEPKTSLMEMIDYIEARGYIVIGRESVNGVKSVIDGWL